MSMTRRARSLAAGAALVTIGLYAPAALGQNVTSTEIVFAVDESGSMAGEQAFLGGFVTSLDAQLAAAGVTDRSYGLTGFGSGIGGSTSADNLGRTFDVGGDLLGSAADFSTATSNLVLSGSFEDGYSAIDTVLNSYTFTPGASVTIVLVTDEDRDVGNAALDFNAVQTALAAQNITLVGVLNADIQDVNGQSAIATDGTNAFLQNGTTTTASPLGSTSGTGTTDADYTQLALSTPNDCVADLNFLRAGGDASTAFAEVFSDCLVTAAVGAPPPTSNDLFLNVYRDSAMIVMNNHRNQVRQVIALDSGSEEAEAVLSKMGLDTKIIADAFNVPGLRAYMIVSYQNGEFDAFGNNKEFDYDGYGTTVGLDYTTTANLMDFVEGERVTVGGSFNYQVIDADVIQPIGHVDLQSYAGNLYVSVDLPEGYYAQADVQLARLKYRQDRIVGGVNFQAEPDGWAAGATFEGGYMLPRMQLDPDMPALALQITPFASLGFHYRRINGFQENNGGLLIGTFDDHSLVARVGGRGTLTYELDNSVFFTTLEGAVAFDFFDDNEEVFLNAGALGTERIESVDDVQFEAKVALGAELMDQINAFIQYDGGFSIHSTQHAVSGNLVINF